MRFAKSRPTVASAPETTKLYSSESAKTSSRIEPRTEPTTSPKMLTKLKIAISRPRCSGGAYVAMTASVVTRMNALAMPWNALMNARRSGTRVRARP